MQDSISSAGVIHLMSEIAPDLIGRALSPQLTNELFLADIFDEADSDFPWPDTRITPFLKIIGFKYMLNFS